MNVLVLCHGNINRSPLCEAVLKEEFKDHPQVIVRSAALKPNAPSHRATRKMREAALDRGYDLDTHRAKEVTDADLHWANWIVYMDKGNLRRLTSLMDVYGINQEREMDLLCLAQWSGDATVTRIPDPNFRKGDSPEFQSTVDLILKCSKRLASHLLSSR